MSNLSNIIIDPNQVFKSNVDLNNLPKDLCLSSNNYLYDFYKSNPHLINYEDLISNESNWVVDLLLEDVDIINKIFKVERGLTLIKINRNNNSRITKFLKDNKLILYEELFCNNNDIAVEIILNEYKNKELTDCEKYELLYDLFNYNDNDKIVDFVISKNISSEYINNIYDQMFYRNYNEKLLEYIKSKNIEVYNSIMINKKYELDNKNNKNKDRFYDLFNKYE